MTCSKSAFGLLPPPQRGFVPVIGSGALCDVTEGGRVCTTGIEGGRSLGKPPGCAFECRRRNNFAKSSGEILAEFAKFPLLEVPAERGGTGGAGMVWGCSGAEDSIPALLSCCGSSADVGDPGITPISHRNQIQG